MFTILLYNCLYCYGSTLGDLCLYGSSVYLLFMCVYSSIFGHEGQDAEDVVYINWLSMVRAGLLGLEFYTPESKSWRQVTSLLICAVCPALEPDSYSAF